jgi:hypothetical protein
MVAVLYGNDHHVKEQAASTLILLRQEAKRVQTAQPSGVSRIRTDDPLLAKQVLYQLSYNPAR